jgi:ATP-dependent Clp protease ATP-binding subunit ClpA
LGSAGEIDHVADPAQQAILQALRASADLGRDWVGTEHMLLGPIRAEESPAAQILRNLGFIPHELHETVKTEITKTVRRARQVVSASAPPRPAL